MHLTPTLTAPRLAAPLRHPAIALLLVAAAAHVPVTPMHLREAPYIGWLFIALTVACVLLAGLLSIRDSTVAWALTGAVTFLAVLAYVVSRTIGLPQIGDDVGNWLEPLGMVSLVSEGLAFALAAVTLTRRLPAR